MRTYRSLQEPSFQPILASRQNLNSNKFESYSIPERLLAETRELGRERLRRDAAERDAAHLALLRRHELERVRLRIII